MELTVRPGRADESPGSDLLEAMVEELVPLYGRIDVPGAPTATPEEMSPPDGAFLAGVATARTPSRAADSSAWTPRRARSSACSWRRTRAARAWPACCSSALEDEARRLGYAIARLDTGPRQPHAQRMYERAGYRPIDNFNANPFASFWGEKRL